MASKSSLSSACDAASSSGASAASRGAAEELDDAEALAARTQQSLDDATGKIATLETTVAALEADVAAMAGNDGVVRETLARQARAADEVHSFFQLQSQRHEAAIKLLTARMARAEALLRGTSAASLAAANGRAFLRRFLRRWAVKGRRNTERGVVASPRS